jgi:hypothetical protein
MAAGTMDEHQLRMTIEALLSVQGRRLSDVNPDIVSALAEPSIRRAMTKEQEGRFFRNLITDVTIAAEERAEGCLLSFRYSIRAPGGQCYVQLRLLSLRCDGQEILRDRFIVGGSGCGTGTATIPGPATGSGQGMLEAVMQVEFYEDASSVMDGSGPRGTVKLPTLVGGWEQVSVKEEK